MTVTDLPHDVLWPPPTRSEFLGMPFDRVTFADVLASMSARRPGQPLRYVVTPNVDHVVKLSRERKLAFIYDDAWLCLCDSKPIWAMSRYLRGDFGHVTGSDLTARMFGSVLRPGDEVALVAGSEEIAKGMANRYPDLRFRIHVPPAGIAANRDALEACVDFLAAQQSRFAFIAIGAPQSEFIAHAWSRRPGATGTALCVGASLEFMLDLKQRAPQWMRGLGLEWLHRLVSEPRRLWRRYVLAVVPLAVLVLTDIRRSITQRA
ncbi:WecB/TagA/CpsF family glycosyltransferase [Aliihoeflea sp. 2WW]|uniref:WecB/TagA/CpsF family glycosyltransferase n=1 Tax=Aliihoeflea sp. 2WW TaxID=1381123 RepID=UPI0004658FA5|nr:WecB/TagA/CpsF family glycosyltransferase [Aliihoeflea sp. 2WW]